MSKAADAAHPFRDVDIFLVILGLDQFFQSAVDKADAGHRLDHHLILQNQVQMHRFRQDGMLRPKSTILCFAIPSHPLCLNGVSSAMR